MRIDRMLWAGLFALVVTSGQAAQQNFNVKYRMAEILDGQLSHKNLHCSYGFRMEVISDDNGTKPESFMDDCPTITANKDERYSIRLYNPLPVRVAVNLTVDGLNSITGQPSGIANGSKWMIEPYSSITIPGWQINDGETRRFFFSKKHSSYAQWQGDRAGKNLAANCGVIGAAYFWNQEELNRYYDEHPVYRYSRTNIISKKMCDSYNMPLCQAAPAPSCQLDSMSADGNMKSAAEKAGTGMGERESHPTTEVDFKYDTGMYSADQALVVYYDFAKKDQPNPFPAMSYEPEMP